MGGAGEAAPAEDEWDEEALGPDPLRSILAEETEAQASTRMWLEHLDDQVTEELAKQRQYDEYKRQLRDQQPPQP